MKKKLLILMMSTAMVLSACSAKSEVPDEEPTAFEKIDKQEQTGSESDSSDSEAAAEDTTNAEESAKEADSEQTEGSEQSMDSESSEQNENAGQSDASGDYAAQIKSEIEELAAGSASLSDELVSVNQLYDKYDELRMNADDQTAMNDLAQWGTAVYKEETQSLLNRIKESNPSSYNEVITEYEKWEKYVPTMAERMSATYADGSIYPMIYAYNEAMRYKREVYGLASVLADLSSDADFHFPDSTPCGYYGDYTGDSYLIITEGMESGSYDILIHFDDTKELHGWGTTEDAPDSDTYLLFTSDDGTVEGYVSHSTLDASFYVTKTDNAVVGPEGAWTFDFQY